MHDRYRPPPSNGWPPPSCANAWQIAEALGGMKAEQARQTEILLAAQQRQIDLPDAIVERLIQSMPRPDPTPPAPSAPVPSPPVGTVREWIMACAMVATCAAVLAGKLPIASAVEIWRRLAGIP